MTLRIDRESHVSMHLQLADEIRRLILTGEWQAPRRIPSEAELCNELQLSRNTVRQALQALEHEGLIIRQPGKGSFVAPLQEQNGLRRFVALVVPYARDPLPASIYRGIQAAANVHGYQVILADPMSSADGVDAMLGRLENAGVCNYIVLPTGGPGEAAHLERMAVRGHAMVYVDRYYAPPPVSFVGSDNYTGGVLATQHLIDLGHTRICYLIGDMPVISSVRERREGYEATMRRAGLEPLPVVTLPPGGEGSIAEFGLGWLARQTQQMAFLEACLQGRDRPTAVFALHDLIAYQVLVAAQRCGLRVPEDLAIAGYNDTEFCTTLDVPLTSVAQDGFAIGHRACELLVRQAGRGDNERVIIRMPVHLVVRASTAGR